MTENNYRIIGDLEIVANAHNDSSLVSVHCGIGTYIEIYSRADGILRDNAFTFRRWALTGKNTKLTGVPSDGYIYVRANRELPTGEIIFSKHRYNVNGTAKDDPSIPKSEIYYYVEIGGISVPMASGRHYNYSLGNLNNEPDLYDGLVKTDTKLLEVAGQTENVISRFSDIDNKDVVSVFEKKQLSIYKSTIDEEYEGIIDRARAAGVAEKTISEYEYTAKASMSMIDYINAQQGSVPLIGERFGEPARLGVRWAEGLLQYTVSYILPMDGSLIGYYDYVQIHSIYTKMKDLIIEETRTATLNATSLSVVERNGGKYVQLVGADGLVKSEVEISKLL